MVARTCSADRRSRSSRSWWCRHSWASASFAAVSTSAMIAGCSVSAGPLTSMTPSSSPVRGSCRGAAVQYHGICPSSKCSAENSCTGAASASAVPMALVPTWSSVQVAPSLKPSESACCSTRADPSRHRMTPSGSVTTVMNREASATLPSTARTSSITRESAELRRRRSISARPSRVPGVGAAGGPARAASHASTTATRAGAAPAEGWCRRGRRRAPGAGRGRAPPGRCRAALRRTPGFSRAHPRPRV